MKDLLLVGVIAIVLWLFTAIRGSYVSKRERTGLRIVPGPCWWISPVIDAPLWLRSLPLLEPRGSVLYLEGVHDPEVQAFLEARPFPNPTPVGPLTVWPRLNFYHVAARPENLEAIATLVTRWSVKRLAIHASLYKEHQLLLEWYEAFHPPDEDQGVFIGGGEITDVVESPMYLPAEVPEARVRDFAQGLSAAFRLIRPAT